MEDTQSALDENEELSLFLIRVEVEEPELEKLKVVLEDYFKETKSHTAKPILSDWTAQKNFFRKFIPIEALAKKEAVASSLAPAQV